MSIERAFAKIAEGAIKKAQEIRCKRPEYITGLQMIVDELQQVLESEKEDADRVSVGKIKRASSGE